MEKITFYSLNPDKLRNMFPELTDLHHLAAADRYNLTAHRSVYKPPLPALFVLVQG